MSLQKYHKKRNFKLTLEPYGHIPKSHKKLLYTIQQHAARHLHYDLRLEMNGVLKSWAVPKGPSLDPSIKRLAVHVEDHPIEYGSFEGIIPAGQYGAGTVILWDTGEWECKDSDVNTAYKKGNLTILLKGKKLKGIWKLIRTTTDRKNWLLIKVDDEYARPEDEYGSITQEKPKSIVSRRSIDEVASHIDPSKQHDFKENYHITDNSIEKAKKSTMPSRIHPELAFLVDKPPDSDEWLHEIKFDGYRIVCFIKDKKVKLMTRNQNDWTKKFPHLIKEILKLKLKNAIFDGELTALNTDQRSDFQILQNSIQNKDTSALVYHVFDLIYLNGADFTAIRLLDRKCILHQLIPTANGMIRYSDHIIGNGILIFKKSCQLSLEGIVSKNINSPYLQTRTHDWLKLKCIERQEFIVVGFTKPAGKRSYFGSLLLGVYSKNNQLLYCGKVGTGFTEESLQNMRKLLRKYITSKIPFIVPPASVGQVTWVQPKIIVEVEFKEWTQDGLLRHPSFKGLRQDKQPQEIIHEKSEKFMKNFFDKKTRKIQSKQANIDYHFTNLDKILYPEQGITKLDLAEYYNKIYKWILPYIMKRPLTIVRCPQGREKCFYQKHINEIATKNIYSINIQGKPTDQPYLYIKDKAGLMALVQFDTLEIHPWGCHIDYIEKPDLITFDLDPSPEVEWKQVIETAYFVKENLEKINLTSFVKTTGGKGLHVVLPIKREYGWHEVEIFAQTFVDYLVSLKPNLYVANISKAKRKEKIFLDYLRNQAGATTIAPYSTRAKENAPVATPLDWNELSNRIKSDTFTIKNLPKRLKYLKKDPWEEFFDVQQQKLRLPKV
jgi:bifunctional non-homologous end joining protein LigD